MPLIQTRLSAVTLDLVDLVANRGGGPRQYLAACRLALGGLPSHPPPRTRAPEAATNVRQREPARRRIAPKLHMSQWDDVLGPAAASAVSEQTANPLGGGGGGEPSLPQQPRRRGSYEAPKNPEQPVGGGHPQFAPPQQQQQQQTTMSITVSQPPDETGSGSTLDKVLNPQLPKDGDLCMCFACGCCKESCYHK